jgi:hypothetical protein
MSTEDAMIVSVILIVTLLSVVGAVYQSRRRGEMLARQAEKRNGEVTKSGFLGRRELHLPIKGSTLLVYSIPGSRYSPPKTFAILKSDSLHLPPIEITRNGVGQKLLGAFGRERILVNDEEFDRQFVVRGEDPFTAQRLLTADIRQRFMDRSMRSLQVKITSQEVRVTILTIPSNDDAYDNFIDTVFSILQKIL